MVADKDRAGGDDGSSSGSVRAGGDDGSSSSGSVRAGGGSGSGISVRADGGSGVRASGGRPGDVIRPGGGIRADGGIRPARSVRAGGSPDDSPTKKDRADQKAYQTIAKGAFLLHQTGMGLGFEKWQAQ